MEWILVAFAVGLVAILMCDVADEVAYWWMLRRTAPHRGDERQVAGSTARRYAPDG